MDFSPNQRWSRSDEHLAALSAQPDFTPAFVLGRVVAAREELAYEPAQAAAILQDLEADLVSLGEGEGWPS